MVKFLLKHFFILINILVMLLGIYKTNNLMANISSSFAYAEDDFITSNRVRDIISSLSAENKIQDISSVFSGSLDFDSSFSLNDSLKKSSDIKDFLDPSVEFYITPDSLRSEDWFNPSFRTVASVMYYGTEFIAEMLWLPYTIWWALESFMNGNRNRHWFECEYYRNVESFPITDRVSYYRYMQIKNEEDSSLKGTDNEPYLGMYKETKDLAYRLLNRYHSMLFSNNNGSIGFKSRKNVYIFISNSPSIPVKIFLDALAEQSSEIKNSIIKDCVENSIFVSIPYSLDLLNKNTNKEYVDIFQHFSKYIDPSVIQDNNLIFVDLAWDGTTVGSLIRNFKRYLVSKGIEEHKLYAEIQTFFPKGLRSNFLNQLSTLPNINVRWSDKYFSYLMKNLFFMMYDNTLLSFIDPQKFGHTKDLGEGFIRWKDSVFLLLDHYGWYRTVNSDNDFYNLVRRRYDNALRVEKEGREKISIPYQDFRITNSSIMSEQDLYSYTSNVKKEIFNTEYRGMIESYDRSVDWAEARRRWFNNISVMEYFMEEILKDFSFQNEALCPWLFMR